MKTKEKYPKKKVPWHFAVIATILFITSYFWETSWPLIAITRLVGAVLSYKFTFRFFVEIHIDHHIFIERNTLKQKLKEIPYDALLMLITIWYVAGSAFVFKGILYPFEPALSRDGISAICLGIFYGGIVTFLVILNKALTIYTVRRGGTLVNLSW